MRILCIFFIGCVWINPRVDAPARGAQSTSSWKLRNQSLINVICTPNFAYQNLVIILTTTSWECSRETDSHVDYQWNTEKNKYTKKNCISNKMLHSRGRTNYYCLHIVIKITLISREWRSRKNTYLICCIFDVGIHLELHIIFAKIKPTNYKTLFLFCLN